METELPRLFDIGTFPARTCHGFGRRSFVRAAAAAPLFASLAQPSATASGNPKAKSVILLWLWGAPSHLDTIDPKPAAPVEYRGPFATIATRTPGLVFTELLPKLAQRSHQFSVVHNNRNFHTGHLEAGSIALTGTLGEAKEYGPNFGSIVARTRPARSSMPQFVSMTRGPVRDVVDLMKGYGGGTLGKAFDPFLLSCSDDGAVDIPALRLLEGLGPNRLGDRRNVLVALDHLRRHGESASFEQWDSSFMKAYALLTSDAGRQAFDLSREPARTRERYGKTTFGQSCLLARRLVEAGVGYVQVNWSQYVEAITPNCDFGWDTHIYNFELLADRLCPIFDRVCATLLDDLCDTGLIDQTLLVCMGEFGRTPKINNQASRDHWPNCYSSIWAGAGIQTGRVIGKSDARGEEPIGDPVTPVMIGTTIADLLGVDTVARNELRVLDGGRVIHELI